MEEAIEIMKYIEYVFGFANAMIGIAMVVYTVRVLKKGSENHERRLISFVKATLIAILLLSTYSAYHFIRELLDFKGKFGSIAEFPEYIIIFFLYIILLGQIVFYDAPDDFFK